MSTHENGPSAPDDDLDGLYSYDVNMDNAFQEFNADMEAPPTGESGGKARNVKKGADLGIEDVVHVAKKRKPIAKLDENRLVCCKPSYRQLLTLICPKASFASWHT